MLKLKVLIIDDEVDYCEIMKNYFVKKDYAVFISHTLKEGLSLLDTAKPDFLLLDNNLPDGKGWSNLDTILGKNDALNVFLVSAYYKRDNPTTPAMNDPRVTIWEKPLSLSLLNTRF